MSLEVKEPLKKSKPNLKHLRSIGIILSFLGICLFVYFVYSVGVNEILEGVAKIGFGGFSVILFLYLLRICVRASAWKLSVYEPYKLHFKDTFQAVIIGEAVSSIIPLGILASGTSKAVAVSNRIPLVAGLSSVATENLFTLSSLPFSSFPGQSLLSSIINKMQIGFGQFTCSSAESSLLFSSFS